MDSGRMRARRRQRWGACLAAIGAMLGAAGGFTLWMPAVSVGLLATGAMCFVAGLCLFAGSFAQ